MVRPNLAKGEQLGQNFRQTTVPEAIRRPEEGCTPLPSLSAEVLYYGCPTTPKPRIVQIAPETSENTKVGFSKASSWDTLRSWRFIKSRQAGHAQQLRSHSGSPSKSHPAKWQSSRFNSAYPSTEDLRCTTPTIGELIKTPASNSQSQIISLSQLSASSHQSTSTERFTYFSTSPPSSPNQSTPIRFYPQRPRSITPNVLRACTPRHSRARTPRYSREQIYLPKHRPLKQRTFGENSSNESHAASPSVSSTEGTFYGSTTPIQHQSVCPQSKHSLLQRNKSGAPITEPSPISAQLPLKREQAFLGQQIFHSLCLKDPWEHFPLGSYRRGPKHSSTEPHQVFTNWKKPLRLDASRWGPLPAKHWIKSAFGGHPGFPNNHTNGNAFGGGLVNGSNFGSNTGLNSMGAAGLGSQEVQLRFTHGNALQQHHLHDGIGATAALGKLSRIREVWSYNFAAEVATIRQLVERYPYVSMDTEFPGVVGRPMGNFSSKADYHYQTLRVNVDMLKLIRLGLTLFSPEGDLPPAQSDMALRGSYANTMTPCTWLFNFKYNIDRDMGGEVNINLLKEKGVDFEKCAEMGIDHAEFGSVLQTSGLTTNDDVYWISFHSGYDFGYLLKAMQPSMMPNTEEEFIDNINEQFPNIWDVKFLYRKALAILQGRAQNTDIVLSTQATTILNNLAKDSKNSLSEIGDELGLPRDIPRPNAALDSIHTGLVFWQMKQKIFGGDIDPSLMGGIWGLSQVGQPASAETRTALLASSANGAQQTPAGLVKGDPGPGTPSSSHGNLASTPVPHGHNYTNLSNVSSAGGFGNFQYRQ